MNRLILKYMAIAVLSLAVIAGTAGCGSDDDAKDVSGTSTAAAKTEKEKKTTSRQKTSTQRTSTAAAGALPDEEQIQEDLIDESIVDPHLGEWVFEDLDEFIEFDIVDSEVSTDPDGFTVAELVIDVRLMDINDGREYNGQLNVTYEQRAEDMPWRLIDVSGEYRSAGPSI